MMNEQKEIDIQLLLKYIREDISEDECNMVRHWLASDDDNKNILNNIKVLLNKKAHLQNYDAVDTEAAWKSIEKSVSKKDKKKSFLTIQGFLRYAAVFIMGVLSVYAAITFKRAPLPESGVTYHTVSAPNGSKASLQLADGSSVTLNGGSVLTYPDKFADDVREVELSGEAYFDIQRNEEHPFTIRTNDMNIRVLGTAFNVKAYPEDETVETYVTSGKVEIEMVGKYRQEKKVFLQTNEKAVFVKGTSESVDIISSPKQSEEENTVTAVKQVAIEKPQLIISEQHNPELEVSWRQDKFIFKKEPMETLVKKLERWYGVEIELNKEGLKKYHFTGTFEQETIEQVMNAMAYSIPIKWEKQHKKILISAKN